MAARNKNLIGPRIQELRDLAGLSQDDLAAKIQLAGWDLSRGGLSKIEAGIRRVNDAEIWVLAKILGLSIPELYPKKPKDVLNVVRQGRG